MQPGGDQPCEVRHVDHQVGIHQVGDPTELREVQLPGVGRPAGHDQLRPVLQREALDLGHVDPEIRLVDVVGHHVVELAGEVEPHAVRQVPAVGQVETEDRVTRLEQGGHRGGIGLCPRVRLHVGEPGPEQRLDPVDRELLDHVDVLAAAVVAAPGIALGVLVGQHRPLGLHHRHRREVLRGDHLQRRLLAVQLGGDGAVHVRVQLVQLPVEHRDGSCVSCQEPLHGRAVSQTGWSRESRTHWWKSAMWCSLGTSTPPSAYTRESVAAWHRSQASKSCLLTRWKSSTEW